MPLETIGSYALAGSSGAVARGARPANSEFTNAAFAASSARGGTSGGIIEIPSPAPNVAAYVSPYIRLDLETRLAIVEFRDAESGRVERQYPSPRAVREYQQNLPENSIFRTDDAERDEDIPDASGVEASSAEPESEGIPGSGSALSGDAIAAPVPPAIASAAAAAFVTHQTAPTSGRQIAVA